MREIKFRICHETNSDKTIIYPDEHSDKYMIGIDGTVYEDYGTKDKPLWENVFDATVFVQQYTGLKDKNGKDIYEGDLLLSAFYRDKENPVEVSWGNENNGWNVNHRNGQKGPLFKIHQQSYEVIGNIFEGLDK